MAWTWKAVPARRSARFSAVRLGSLLTLGFLGLVSGVACSNPLHGKTSSPGGTTGAGGVAGAGAGGTGAGGTTGAGGVIGQGGGGRPSTTSNMGGTNGATTDSYDCGPLTNPANGSVTYTWYEATYSCSVGYYLSGNPYRICQDNGPWSGTAPTCILVDCGAVSAPAHGSVTAWATSYASTATYACAIGYAFSGNPTRTCQASGTWSGTAPTCALLDCGAPPSPSGLSVSAPATTFEATATYACAAGYGPSGSSTRTCQLDGTWSGVTPACVVASCPALPEPNGGTVFAATLSYGATAQYSCSPGYSLSGGQTRTCQADGTWTGAAAQCLPVDCGPPAAPPNGFVTAAITTYASTAIYACATGYALSGISSRTCQADGNWSDTAPDCLVCADGKTTCDGACVDPQTDNRNCGACRTVCAAVSPSTAQCTAGRCLVTLATPDEGALDLAVDATAVYWTSGLGGTVVMKVPLDGGIPVTLAEEQDSPTGIAVDATSVYWTNASTIEGVGTVNMMSRDGGNITGLAIAQRYPQGIVVDDKNAYWTDLGGGSDGAGTVMKVPLLGGGNPIPLASGLFYPYNLAIDTTSVYWTNAGIGDTDGSVMKVPLRGGAVTTLASGQSAPFGIVVDPTDVYWATRSTQSVNSGAVMKVPLGGGAPTTLASGQGDPGSIAVDATSVFWADRFNHTLLKVSRDGGTPITLLALPSAQCCGQGIAVDATSVYWSGGGAVMKLTPK